MEHGHGLRLSQSRASRANNKLTMHSFSLTASLISCINRVGHFCFRWDNDVGGYATQQLPVNSLWRNSQNEGKVSLSVASTIHRCYLLHVCDWHCHYITEIQLEAAQDKLYVDVGKLTDWNTETKGFLISGFPNWDTVQNLTPACATLIQGSGEALCQRTPSTQVL